MSEANGTMLSDVNLNVYREHVLDKLFFHIKRKDKLI